MGTYTVTLTRDQYGGIIWRYIHKMALDVDSEDSHDEFVEYILKVKELYECDMCRGHIEEYIDKYGLPIWSIDDAFEWSVTFHNRVNKRLMKPQLSLTKAYEMYS